jgi:hypothetical protein
MAFSGQDGIDVVGGWAQDPSSLRMLTEALFDCIRFALHNYQDVSALSAGHSALRASIRLY